MKPRNKRKCLRTLALGLAVSLLTGMFSSAQTAAEMPLESAAEENILQNQELWSPVEDVQQLNTEGDMSLEELATAQLPPEDIPEMVTDAQIAEKEHVNRLWEQEEDLNTVIFQNRDGSKTLYYFDYAVKYVDENGVVRDKKNLLSGDIAEPSLVEDYGYVNADNDIQTYFPKTLDRDNGVVLTYGEYRIEMAPVRNRVKAPLMAAAGLQATVRPGEQQTSGLREIMLEAQTAPAVKKQTDAGQTTEHPSDVVEYAGIFGDGTLLRYTPTFEGYKEDLILAGPEAGNRFTFVVDAGDLQVVAENQAVYFLNPLTGEIQATMDPLYVYDSFAGDSPHTTYGNDLLCTRLEDGTYEITMVVDEAFLNDPATVYPVVVDPSLTISASGIEDATIYTNYKVTDGKTSQALYVGSYTARYGSRGVARTLMQFPGLLTNSTFAAIPTAQINSVKLYLRDLQCEVDTVRIDCYRSTFSWNEATVKCSQNLWNGYDSTLLDYASVHYNGGTTGPGTTVAGNWYDFNITSAVKYWKNGGYTNGGILLKASNESSGARSFASSERGSYTPVVMVDYGYAVSQVCLNTTNMEMEINDTAYLRASVVPAAASQSVYFTSSNPNVVSVGATGLLCAKSAGTAVITVVSAVDSSKFASCRVKVLKKAIIIVPGIMGTELKLELAEGKFAAGTKVWPPMEENEEAGLDTIAKLKLIRPLDSALTVNNDDNYGTFDEYKSLYNYLEQNFGSRYDVVFFGYDWRRPNGVSAQLLKEKVNTYDKSIIIAHSMGGLVASHLVKNADNHSKIEKVITLGTPFLGSLEMLPVFAEGDLSAIDNALKDVNPILAFFAKNLMLRPVLKELAVDIPSLYELLPNQMFFSLGNRHCLSIMSAGEQQLVTYEQTKQYLPYFIPDMEQGYFKNAILYNNSLWSGNTHCTSTVDSYYIIGEGVDTLRTYTAQFEVQNNIYSASFVQSGDGSVLSYSASMNDLYPSKTFFVNSGHGDLTKLNGDDPDKDDPEILNFIRNLINGSTTLTKGIRTEPNKPI